MSEDVEGTVLVERYTLVRQLGAGGMGRVYLADDTMLNRKVAIKQILTHATITDGTGAARAMREARVAARLDHPYAVPVYDVFTIDDEPYMVMGYVEGESLAERLDRDRRVPLAQAGKLIGQTASALAAAHEMDIVHRDIKPANILITKRGSATLADFGIARATSDPSMTSTGMVIGSVAYMAPEVAQGDPASGASDVFSLGATFFAALEGKPPFDGDSSATILLKLVSEPAPRSPAAGPLSGLLGAMLEKEPGNRPTAEEVEDALLNRAPLERWRRFDRGAVVPGPRPGVLPPTGVGPAGGYPQGGQPASGRYPQGGYGPGGPAGRPGQAPNQPGRGHQPPPPSGSPRVPGSMPRPAAGQRPVLGPPPRVQSPGPSGPPAPTRPAGGTVGGPPQAPLAPPGGGHGSQPSAPSAPSGPGVSARPASALPPPPPGARPVSTSGPQPPTSGPRPAVSRPSGPAVSGPAVSGPVGPPRSSGPHPQTSGPRPPQTSGPRPPQTSGPRPPYGAPGVSGPHATGIGGAPSGPHPAVPPKSDNSDVLKGVLAGAVVLIVILVIVAIVL